MIVYPIAALAAVLLAAASQKKKIPLTGTPAGFSYCYAKNYNWLFYLSFLVLAVVSFLTKSGTDIPAYANYYETWTLDDLKQLNFEPGIRLIFIVLHWIIPDPYVGLGVIKVLSLALLYRCLYLNRHRINLGLAVLGYSILLFIYNFQLLRMMPAVHLTFLALTYEMQGKSKKCIFLLLISLTFHYTSIIALFAYILYRMLGKGISKWKIIVVAVLFMSVYALAEELINTVTSQFAAFSKYAVYSQKAERSIGALQFVLLLPVVGILFSHYRFQKKNKDYMLAMVWGIMVTFTGMLGYLFPVISRTVYYFYFFFLVFASSCVLRKERISVRISAHKRIPFSLVCFIVYLIFQVIAMYFLNDSFKSNGLEEYILLWH